MGGLNDYRKMNKLIAFTKSLSECVGKVVFINPDHIVKVEEGLGPGQTKITTVNKEVIVIDEYLSGVIEKLNRYTDEK